MSSPNVAAGRLMRIVNAPNAGIQPVEGTDYPNGEANATEEFGERWAPKYDPHGMAFRGAKAVNCRRGGRRLPGPVDAGATLVLLLGCLGAMGCSSPKPDDAAPRPLALTATPDVPAKIPAAPEPAGPFEFEDLAREIVAPCRADSTLPILETCDGAVDDGHQRLAGGGEAALEGVVALLDSQDPKLRAVALRWLDLGMDHVIQRMRRPPSSTLVGRALAVFASLDAAAAVRAVVGITDVCWAAGALEQWQHHVEARPEPAVRLRAMARAPVMGRLEGFAMARSYVERAEAHPPAAPPGEFPTTDQWFAPGRSELLAGVAAGAPWTVHEQTVVCPWIVEHVRDRRDWVRGRAVRAGLQTCPMAEIVGPVAEEAAVGRLPLEVAREVQAACSDDKRDGCDDLNRLMHAGLADGRLAADSRAMCLEGIVRMSPGPDSDAVLRAYVNHPTRELRDRAQTIMDELAFDPYRRQ